MTAIPNTTSRSSGMARAGLWLGWVGVTVTGWGLGWFISAIQGFSSGIYDPDEVEAYQRMSPGQTLITALIMGAVFGLIFGAPLGLYQWLGQKRGLRQGLIAAGITVGLSMLACVFSAPGPTQVVGVQTVNISTGFVGGFFGGAWAGILQYFLLRRAVSGYWVPATILAWAAASAGIMALQPAPIFPGSLPDSPVWQRLIVPLAGGALVGLAQWPFLRRAYRDAIWWIPAAALAWLATYWLSLWIDGWGIAAAAIISATAIVMLSGRPQEMPAGEILDKPVQ